MDADVAYGSPLIATPGTKRQASEASPNFGLGHSDGGVVSAWPDRHARPRVAPNVLERLCQRLGAGEVSLIRFERSDDVFEVVTTAGPNPGIAFLAPGVRLPVAGSTLALAASRGRLGRFVTARGGGPVERIAVLLGLESAIAMPIMMGTTALGAAIALWAESAAPVSDPHALAGDLLPELTRTLVAPDSVRRHVLVCHEDALTAGGLARLVQAKVGVGARVAFDLSGALAAAAASRLDLVVLSDHLSETQPVTEVARLLRDAGTSAPLMVLARADGIGSLDAAVGAGATGYLPRVEAATRLVAVATAMLKGRCAMPTRSRTDGAPSLSRREQDVLRGVDRGLSDKQIARELGLAVSTVKTHGRGIYRKLGATSRTGAVHRAREAGLL